MSNVAMGQPVEMFQARSRVDGRLGFALNAEVPGMLHARLFRSDVPHARISSLDVEAAEQMPGVVAVLTAADLAGDDAPSGHFGPIIWDQPVVCGHKARFAGDPIAAIAAETEEAAEAALLAIDVEYEELPLVSTVDAALAEDAALVHEGPPRQRDRSYADINLLGRQGNICTKFQLRTGDVERGFAAADVIVENVYESPAVQHVPMEPHVVLASYEDGTLQVTSATQSPYAVRDTLAEMFRMPTSAVRVRVPPLGGGYGAKTYAKFEPVAAALSWKAGRPVKLVLSRTEEFHSITKHGVRIHMRTGATKDGRLLARDVQAYFNAGAYADISPRLIKNGGYSCVGPYVIPNVRIDSYAVYTNLPPAGAFRGYGVSQAAWAYEQQMEELADALGIDSVELRRRNVLRDGSRFATGEVMREARWEQLLDRSAAAIDLGSGRRVELDDNRVIGKGVAVILKSTITPSTSTAAVRLDADGSLQVLTSAVEMGQGAHTVLAQLAADPLTLPVTAVNVAAPDTQYTPYDQTSSSSRLTRAVGGSVIAAAEEVRGKLLALASDIMEVAPTDLVLDDGAVHIRGHPTSSLSIADVFWRARAGSISGSGEVRTTGGLDPETGHGVASDHWHQGAAGAEVEVDLGTGKVYVRHIHAAAYAGRVVNPKLAELQIHGSIFFAMGQALYEELVYDDGILTNPNLSDYAIVSMGDVPPRLTIDLLEDDDAEIHGLGETCLPPVLAAIGNAVSAAIGARVTCLPLTPERVLSARRR